MVEKEVIMKPTDLSKLSIEQLKDIICNVYNTHMLDVKYYTGKQNKEPTDNILRNIHQTRVDRINNMVA